MLLLDINFTLFGPFDRDDDRIALYDRAKLLGPTAWASDSQFYLLTECEFADVMDTLGFGLFATDFLKVQEVRGRFAVLGRFPSAVDRLFQAAAELGLIETLLVRPRQNLLAAK
jgi:hypothetical protein